MFYLVFSGFWYYKDDAIAINIHDTYFIILKFHITILLFFVFFILGLIYWMSLKQGFKLINVLTKIHTIITIGSVFAYFFVTYIFDLTDKIDFPLLDNQSKFDFFTLFLIVVSGFAQIVLLFNLIKSGVQTKIE